METPNVVMEKNFSIFRSHKYYFPGFFLGGFNEGVLPGVSLLSRWRLSGFPVDSAILLGPGLSAIIFNALIITF